MKKNIVLDNIIFSLQSKGGVSRVWRSLCSHIQADSIKTTGNYNSTLLCRVFSKMFRYLPVGLYWATKRHVFLSSYYRVSLHPLASNVVLVHDLIYEKFHHFSLGTFLHITQRRFAFWIASKIICVSENTRRDLLEFYPRIDPTRVIVIPNGVDEAFISSSNRISVRKENQFLYVGSRGSCKNFPKVIEALRLFPELQCICVMSPFSDQENLEYSDVLGRIEIFSGIEDRELINFYSGCKFVLMPSLYEGFGLPVIEAFGLGTNVVLPHAHSFPEVAGVHGIYYSPDSRDSFKLAIEKALRWDAPVDLLRAHAKSFSWRSIGARYTKELFE